MGRNWFHSALVWLGVLGFVAQCLWAGAPGGHALCIGCDRGSGWAVGAPCASEAVNVCCGDESPDHPVTPPTTPDADDCGCLDVPLRSSVDVAASVQRAEPGDGGVPLRAAVPWPWHDSPTIESGATCVWSRAGPGVWVRLMTPLSRGTVLVI